MWNVRLRLAAFSSASNTRYCLVSFGPQPTGSAGEEQQRQRAGRLYKGPAVNLLQPGGIGGAAGRGEEICGAALAWRRAEQLLGSCWAGLCT